MIKIALFGGAFDPITISHSTIAQQLSNYFDEVWIQPCYKSYYGKNMTSGFDRIQLCQILIDELKLSKVKVSTFEICNKITCPTWKIISDMILLFPNINFYFIIGADNAQKFTTWENWNIILKLVNVVVIPRENMDISSLNYPFKYMNEIIAGDSSSTKVRDLIKQKDYNGLNKYITQKVLEYILERHLYI